MTTGLSFLKLETVFFRLLLVFFMFACLLFSFCFFFHFDGPTQTDYETHSTANGEHEKEDGLMRSISRVTPLSEWIST